MAVAATTTETDLPAVPTFEEAASAALKQHSTPADDATGDDDAGDEHAGAADDDQGEGDEKPAGKPGRAAAAKPAEKSGDSDEGEGEGEGDDEPTALLSEAEWGELQKTHGKDPAALFKALNTAFTTKSQGLAEVRGRLEKLEAYAPVVEAYETDAEGTLRLLAEQNGFTLVKGDAKPGEGKPGTAAAAAAETPEARLTAALDKFKASVVEKLGPDLDYLAEPLTAALGPAMKDLVSELTQSEIKPLRDVADRQTAREVELRTDQVMADFEKAHPDWKEHEAAMTKLGEKILPSKGATELEHLENLYKLATGETTVAKLKKDIEAQVAEGVKKALEKMNKGAEGAGRRERDVSARQVETKYQGVPTFDDAAAAALRGERFT